MEICSRNHEEIVHDNGYDSCPLCEKIKEIEKLESYIQDLKDENESEIEDLKDENESEIEDLKDEIEDLKDEIENLKDEIEDLNIQLNKND